MKMAKKREFLLAKVSPHKVVCSEAFLFFYFFINLCGVRALVTLREESFAFLQFFGYFSETKTLRKELTCRFSKVYPTQNMFYEKEDMILQKMPMLSENKQNLI